MNKPLIVWDVDDVLNDLTREWFDEYAPHVSIKYSDLTQNPPHEELNITRVEYLRSLDNFRHRRANDLNPLPEAIKWFTEHGARYRHIALTAVPRKFAHISAAWVMKHFGNWIRTFHFVPSPRPDDRHPEYDTGKAEFMLHLDTVDLFIDDNEKNIMSAVQSGLPGALFPRPWNDSRLSSIGDFLNKILIKQEL